MFLHTTTGTSRAGRNSWNAAAYSANEAIQCIQIYCSELVRAGKACPRINRGVAMKHTIDECHNKQGITNK